MGCLILHLYPDGQRVFLQKWDAPSEFLEQIARGEIKVNLNSADCAELDLETAEFSSDQNQ